jgi:dihydroorotate dehydrogenase
MWNSLKLWPAVTAFSFAFIPLEYRSIFAGVIAVGWQTYLSFLNRLAEREEEKEGVGHGMRTGRVEEKVEGKAKERVTVG